MTAKLNRSYAYCEQLARREAGNFYHGFRLLPRDQRRAMCALYAFLRLTDDLTDQPGPVTEKRALLEDWRSRWRAALAGEPSHPVHAALCHAVRKFHIPHAYLEEAITGVGMDLERCAYETFADLYPYCYRVASVVGLCCIHIWGFTDPRAEKYAEAAGIAFQLTNILRDLKEDAERGRVYLPREDLQRFQYTEEDLRHGVRDERFRALMRFQSERAAGYYEASRPLAELLSPAGRAIFLVMAGTYRSLLDAIVRSDYDVFSQRVTVRKGRKLGLVARAIPVRLGWW